jgi:hypothetical protein
MNISLSRSTMILLIFSDLHVFFFYSEVPCLFLGIDEFIFQHFLIKALFTFNPRYTILLCWSICLLHIFLIKIKRCLITNRIYKLQKVEYVS